MHKPFEWDYSASWAILSKAAYLVWAVLIAVLIYQGFAHVLLTQRYSSLSQTLARMDRVEVCQGPCMKSPTIHYYGIRLYRVR